MGVETYYDKLTGIIKVSEAEGGGTDPQNEEQELANKQYFKSLLNSAQASEQIEEKVDKISEIKEDM